MAHEYKDGDTAEVPGYGSGVVYDVGLDQNEHAVRVKLDSGVGSVRVDARNLTKVKAHKSATTDASGAFAGTRPTADIRDKAVRGPRE